MSLTVPPSEVDRGESRAVLRWLFEYHYSVIVLLISFSRDTMRSSTKTTRSIHTHKMSGEEKNKIGKTKMRAEKLSVVVNSFFFNDTDVDEKDTRIWSSNFKKNVPDFFFYLQKWMYSVCEMHRGIHLFCIPHIHSHSSSLCMHLPKVSFILH